MSVERKDDLSLYYDSVKRHPLLTAEEERELSRSWRNDKNRAAADRLVLSNMRAVIKIAGEYSNQHVAFSDLLQEGTLGLLRAVDRYDPERGVRFLSYAAWWIRAYIRDHLLRTRSLVRLGTTQRQRTVYSRLGKANAEVAREGLEGEARMERLVEIIGVDRKTIESMQGRLKGYDVSLDAPVGPESDATPRSNFIPDTAIAADVLLADGQEQMLERKRLMLAIAELPAREQEIICRRHLVDKAETLEMVGKRLGVSRERVRQLESRALRRIRTWVAQDSWAREVA